MTLPNDGHDPRRRTCEWISRTAALRHFATYDGPTQSQQHIKPLHWYVACRLVLEGGFHPDELTPRPPFSVTNRRGRSLLHYSPETATGSEATILGGLKTKNVDIVIDKPGVGPVVAVSCKGMTGAFRNLTNRMEETIGECTNLHIRYPALVFGYFFVIRANRIADAAGTPTRFGRSPSSRQLGANDVALDEDGRPVEAISRFHVALGALTGRDGIRSDPSRYEAIALAMVDVQGAQAGGVLDSFPASTSALRPERFFGALYRQYDERNVVSAPDLAARHRRIAWSADSPALTIERPEHLDYDVRTSG